MDSKKVQHIAGSPDNGEKKKGTALLLHDLREKKLIPTKILFFAVLSSISVLLPYMTIHMKSLGLSVQETAVIYGVFPLFSIVAPYTMGMIADKLGNFKILLSVTMLMAMANALLFLVIPTGRYIDKYPRNLSLAIGCDGSGFVALKDLDSKNCTFKDWTLTNLTLTVAECGYVCMDRQASDNRAGTVKQSASFLPADWPPGDQPYHKMRNAIFLRDTWHLQVSCSEQDAHCTLQPIDKAVLPRNVTFDNVALSKSNDKLDTMRAVQHSPNGIRRAFKCDASYGGRVALNKPLVFHSSDSLDKDKGVLRKRETMESPLNNEDIEYTECRSECIAQMKRSDLCTEDAEIIEYDPQLTFWLYLVMRVFYAILLGGSMVLFEGACLAVVIEYKGDLGLQRLFGVLGTMIFSPVSGALIDHFSHGQSVPDFRPAFYLYAVLVGIAAIGILAVDLDFKPPAKELLKDMKSILRNVELDVFLIVTLMSGLFWGFIESYLFWFLEEMGGSKSLMGLTVTVSSLSGIPALLVSDMIFRRIGHPNIQVIGFLVYIVRLVGYSYIYNPYMCLIYEALEAITTSLMTTSAIAYSAQLSTKTTLATVQGMIGGTYYGLGRGAGSFVGGLLMKEYGTRAAFRMFGCGAGAVAVLYFTFNYLYIRPRHRNDDKTKMKPNDSDASMTRNSSECSAENGLGNPAFIPDDPAKPGGDSNNHVNNRHPAKHIRSVD